MIFPIVPENNDKSTMNMTIANEETIMKQLFEMGYNLERIEKGKKIKNNTNASSIYGQSCPLEKLNDEIGGFIRERELFYSFTISLRKI